MPWYDVIGTTIRPSVCLGRWPPYLFPLCARNSREGQTFHGTESDAIQWIEKLHGKIGYGKDRRSVFTVCLNLADVQELAGSKGLAEVPPATDADMTPVSCFHDLQSLDLSRTRVGDEGLRKLSGLHNLGWLSLEGTKVTDAGLKEIACHTNLGCLNLAATQISGRTFSDLAGLSNLQRLDLSAIPGTSYSGLACLTNLRDLCLRYGDLTVTDVKEITNLVALRLLCLQDMAAGWFNELAQLYKRSTMHLYEARLSESRLSELQANLPQCKIRIWCVYPGASIPNKTGGPEPCKRLPAPPRLSGQTNAGKIH